LVTLVLDNPVAAAISSKQEYRCLGR